MNEIKYLNEFDTVLFSPEDAGQDVVEQRIAYAHKRLYQEVFLKGNIVVFTSNQVTNSLAFVRLAEDTENLNNFFKLFEMGRIKISLSDNSNTSYESVSHIVQEHLAKYLKDPKSEEFIFSSMDIDFNDKTLVKDFSNALKNSSIAVFDNYLDNTQGSKIPFLRNYVKLITTISMNQDRRSSFHKNLNSLSYYIQRAKECIEKKLPNIYEIICIVEDKYENASKRKKQDNVNSAPINTRSYWYAEIDSITPNRELNKKCKRFVDVCYNFCSNDNIDGISSGYANSSTFSFEFMNAMNLAYDSSMVNLPNSNWGLAVEVFEMTPFHTIEKNSEIRLWRRHLRKAAFINLLISLLVSTIFVLAQTLLSLGVNFGLDSIPEDALEIVINWSIIAFFINIIAFIIILTVFNKLLAKRNKKYNITTSFKKMGLYFKSLLIISKYK